MNSERRSGPVDSRSAALSRLRVWWRRATTRRALRALAARQLQDAGLAEQDRAAECAKWFWQD